MKLWDDVAVAALVGTERQPAPQTGGEGALDEALSRLAGDSPEEQLLGTAATAGLWQRAGLLPQEASGVAWPAPEPDELPECTKKAGDLLKRILDEGESFNREQITLLLLEWMELAASAKVLPAADTLPLLLRRAEGDKRVREQIQRDPDTSVGRRGQWLTKLNPEWSFAAASGADDASIWEEGTTPQRVAFLEQVRESEPARAIELLREVWSQENAQTRTTLLAVLERDLSGEDETFLEEALDDRSKTVRQEAAKLLSRLPESAFSHRMAECVSRSVKISKGMLGKTKIAVDLPETVTDAMKRDSIEEPKTPPQSMGTKGAVLNQIIALTPLSHWTTGSGTDTKSLLAAAGKSDWSVVLLNGWSQAAMIQRNDDWLLPILRHLDSKDHQLNPRDLCGRLSQEKMREYLAGLTENRTRRIDAIMAALDGLQVTLDPETTSGLLEMLSPQVIAGRINQYEAAATLGSLAKIGDAHCASRFQAVVGKWLEKDPSSRKSFREALNHYELRCAMHEEIGR